ncbi:MAG: amino acid--tRNA ligase-related protein [Pseudonocardiaceae bacterium]
MAPGPARSDLREGFPADTSPLPREHRSAADAARPGLLGTMEYGMPSSGGMGMGIDRLLMVSRVRVSVRPSTFPLVRPQ